MRWRRPWRRLRRPGPADPAPRGPDPAPPGADLSGAATEVPFDWPGGVRHRRWPHGARWRGSFGGGRVGLGGEAPELVRPAHEDAAGGCRRVDEQRVWAHRACEGRGQAHVGLRRRIRRVGTREWRMQARRAAAARARERAGRLKRKHAAHGGCSASTRALKRRGAWA
jgi:hypothetical protein